MGRERELRVMSDQERMELEHISQMRKGEYRVVERAQALLAVYGARVDIGLLNG